MAAVSGSNSFSVFSADEDYATPESEAGGGDGEGEGLPLPLPPARDGLPESAMWSGENDWTAQSYRIAKASS